MVRLRVVSVFLGLALVTTTACVAAALTPEQEAALRAQAISLTEAARGLEASADQARENAAVALALEFNKADGLEDQADFKRISALGNWLQLGDGKQVKASELREEARALLVDAFQYGVLAVLADMRAENERARAEWQRTTAAALLASGSDAATLAAAKALNKEAERDDKDAAGYEKEADRLRDRAERTNLRVAALIARAVELETAAP